MKTDNSIVVATPLENAAKKWYGELKPGNTAYNRNYNSYVQGKITACIDGANWQKEQYKPLIESHAELLDWVKRLKDIAERHIDEFNIPDLNITIEKANNLI